MKGAVERKRVIIYSDGIAFCPHCSRRQNFALQIETETCLFCNKPVEILTPEQAREAGRLAEIQARIPTAQEKATIPDAVLRDGRIYCPYPECGRFQFPTLSGKETCANNRCNRIFIIPDTRSFKKILDNNAKRALREITDVRESFRRTNDFLMWR